MYNNTTVSSVIMWNVPVLLIFLFVRYCGKHHPPHDETLAANRELEMVEKASQKAVARKPKNYSSFFFIISLPWFESAVSRPQREERLGYQESIQLPAKRPYAKNRNRGPGFLFRVEIRSAQNPDHSKNSENGQWNQGHYWTQRNTKTK